jgi:nitrogen fixation/metabolism regulation signal transduction histidine kinase
MADRTQRHRRQLRNLLIDRKVQLRITVVMLLIGAVLTAGLGYIWYAETRTTSQMIRVNALATLDAATTREVEARLASQDRQLLLVLVGFSLLLGVLIAGYGIVMTHKLAGPLTKIARHMNDIEANRLYPLWELRKGDQLQDFFATFKRMHAALRARVEADMILFNRLMAAIDRGDDLRGQLPAIKERLTEKGDSLRDASETTQKIIRSEIQ